jgi:RNA polymerase sigma-70 factor (ECF subfamily)
LIRPEQSDSSQAPTISSPDGDVALVAAVLRKDRKATAEFVAHCADEVFSYVRSRLAPRYDQVDDLVQDVFLAAWKSLRQYRGEGPLRAWVMAIARHKVEDYYRQCLRAPEPLEETDSSLGAWEAVADFQKVLDRDQLRRKTLQVIEQLPVRYRLALLWRYWEKASARDMAVKTGKTEKAIERLLARARAEFRERWNREST